METLGFVGLGTMGKPMATRLLEAGYRILVSDTFPKPVTEMAAKGAEAPATLKGMAEKSGIIFVSLPDSGAVESVVYPPGELMQHMRAGSILVDLGTSDPVSTRRIAADLWVRNIGMLDAPVSGGEMGALHGTLSCMVGGPKEMLDRVRPMLEKVASTIRYIGDHGMGHTMKLLNNMVGVGNLVILCEVLSIATAVGVDPDVALDVLGGGSAWSKALEFWGKRLVARDYQTPIYRFDLAAKDMRLANALAVQSGVPFPMFAGTNLTFTTASACGLAREDVCAIKGLWDGLQKRPGPGG